MNARKRLRLPYLLFSIVLCGMLVLLTACKPALPAPSGVNVDAVELKLYWNPVWGPDAADAGYYTVRIEGEDGVQEVDRSDNSYPLDGLAEGSYTLYVKAVAGGSGTHGDSAWSAGVPFVREHESGLILEVTNGNTAFTVTGQGLAKGDIVIPDIYRGLPVTGIAEQAFFNSNSITSVSVGANVREIGKQAFAGCTNLERLRLAEGLTEIGEQAFSNCRKLTGTLALPDSLITIGEQAFSYCRVLPSVTFGKGLVSIGESAFAGCWALGEAVLPANVTQLGAGAFSDCKALAKADVGGVTALPESAYQNCIALADVGLQSVTSIGANAFQGCTALQTVSLPQTLTDVGDKAFFGSALQTVSLPQSVTRVGKDAFVQASEEGGKTYLPAVTREDDNFYLGGWLLGTSSENSVTAKAETVGIADGALQGSAITQINLTDTQVAHIGANAFKDCVSLTAFLLGERVQTIGEKAFDGCTALETAILGANGGSNSDPALGASNLADIGSYAFQNCTLLTDIDLPQSVTHIGTYAFHGSGIYKNAPREVFADDWLVECKADTFEGNLSTDKTDENDKPVEGFTLRGIADYAVYDCDFITGATLPESVEIIGRGAFQKSEKLAAIVLPSGLKVIDEYTFYGCTALTKVQTREKDEEGVLRMVDGLPAALTKIGKSAFYRCPLAAEDEEMKVLAIPAGVTEIGDFAFYGCGASHMQGNGEELEVGITAFELGDGVQTIGEKAFAYNNALRSVTFGENVQTIGERAFYGCGALVDATFTGSKLTSVGERAFYGCSMLKEALLPESVTEIGDYAFYRCASLERVTLGSITAIGAQTFLGCSSLTDVVIPASVTSVGTQAFRGCTALGGLVLRASVTSVGTHAFFGCRNLTVYTDAAADQSGWQLRWNSSYRPVVYGCTLSANGELAGFTTGNIVNMTAVTQLSAPVHAGGTFAGWATRAGGDAVYTMQDLLSLPDGTALYPVWYNA